MAKKDMDQSKAQQGDRNLEHDVRDESTLGSEREDVRGIAEDEDADDFEEGDELESEEEDEDGVV